MSQSILFNGTAYEIPDTGDTDWGENLTEYFVAIPQGALQKTGGLFTLTADVNFGASFGLLAAYLKSVSSNIATAGIIRLARTDGIVWRNVANDGNLILTVNGSNQLLFNGVVIPLSGLIVNADIAANAAIARSKLASGTNYRILANDATGVMSENAALTSGRVVIVDSNGQLADEAELAISRGGTGEATASDAFDALSPMTTEGDIIYGGASGTGTRLPADTDGKVLTLSGGVPTWQLSNTISAPTVQTFTAGTGTYTLPTSPTPLYIKVTMVGAGGGGSGSGSAGAANGGDGSADTTFGAALTAGFGGGGAFSSVGGAGGSASITTSGTVLQVAEVAGGSGTAGSFPVDTQLTAGGPGGNNAFGGAGGGGYAAAGNDAAANSGSGGGGGGGNTTGSVLGGSGGGAGGYVCAIITSPSSTYAYAVGTGGSGGTAGTSGSAGGNGADGYIVVEEFYQ